VATLAVVASRQRNTDLHASCYGRLKSALALVNARARMPKEILEAGETGRQLRQACPRCARCEKGSFPRTQHPVITVQRQMEPLLLAGRSQAGHIKDQVRVWKIQPVHIIFI
jgi:hypothetical protein